MKLTVDGKVMTQSLEIKKDPRLETTPAEFARQLELLLKIRDKFSETSEAILQIRDARKQIDEITNRLKDQPGGKPIADAAKSLKAKLAAVEEELYQTKNQSNQDPLNYPIRLNNKLAATKPKSTEGARFWDEFRTVWGFWNHIRWIGALGAAAAFIMAMVEGSAPMTARD